MAAALVAPMLRPLRGVGGAGRAAPRKQARVGVKCSAENDRYGQSEDDVLQVSGDWRQFRCVSPRHTVEATFRKARDAKKHFPRARKSDRLVFTSHEPRVSGKKKRISRRVQQKTLQPTTDLTNGFPPSFLFCRTSAALVNQERTHRLTGGTNHVVSAFDRRQRRNKSPVDAADWAHRLPEAETGCLLLAPEHEEGWWRHSVVLVLNHDDEGSTGVILNRPTNALLHRVVPEIDYEAPHHKVLADRRVSMGGPMGTEKGSRCLVALSAQPLEGATSEVFPGLWHVSDFAAVRPEHEKHLSVFVGYCGWVEGQLDAEVKAGGWLVAAASAANTLGLVSTAPGGDLLGESAWESLRARLGENSDNAARG